MSDLNYAPNSRPVGRLRPPSAWLIVALALVVLAAALGAATDQPGEAANIFASPVSQQVHLDWRGNSAGLAPR